HAPGQLSRRRTCAGQPRGDRARSAGWPVNSAWWLLQYGEELAEGVGIKAHRDAQTVTVRQDEFQTTVRAGGRWRCVVADPDGHERGGGGAGVQASPPQVEGGKSEATSFTKGADTQTAVLPVGEELPPALGTGVGGRYTRHGKLALPGVVGSQPGRAGP